MEDSIMKKEIQSKLELFTENTQGIRKWFRLQDSSAKRLAAMIYALSNKKIDCEAIEKSHLIIKDNTGIFSMFRGNMAMCIAAMMSLNNEREKLFNNTITVYEMMKESKFRASDYLAVAAYEIASQGEQDDYRQIVARAREFYNGMKANNWFRVGEDDYIYSAMLGLTDIDVKTGAERIEQVYQQIKKHFRSKNCVQALAQVLVLSGDCGMAAERVITLKAALKERGIRLDRAFTLPSLGALALLPAEVDDIAREIDEAQAYLRAQKGFGTWSVSKQELHLFAAAMVAAAYADDIKRGVIAASVATSIASIIITQQIVVLAAIMASSVTVTAAASSR